MSGEDGDVDADQPAVSNIYGGEDVLDGVHQTVPGSQNYPAVPDWQDNTQRKNGKRIVTVQSRSVHG